MVEFIPRMDRRLRDVKLFQQKIESIPMRVIVEGTRGKSSTVRILEELMRGLGKKTFAKVTGEATPLLIYNGVVIPLYRKHHVVLLDYETIPTILNFDIDAIVLENQAVTPYTMRYVHSILKPQHVIIPNIRLDHNETLGSDLEEMVHNFVDNYRLAKSRLDIYYAEPIDEVRAVVLPILEEFVKESGKKVVLHTVRIPKEEKHIPCIENYLVDKFFIQWNFGIPINEVSYVRPSTCTLTEPSVNEAEYLRRLNRNLTIRQNSRSIRYANLAKVNDPFSFLKILEHMFGGSRDDVALFAYFRKDRPGRTKLFEDIFPEIEHLMGDRIRKIWLAGYATEHVLSRLPPSYRAVTEIIRKIDDIDSILSYVKEHNLVLVPMVNSVNPFMMKLKKDLEEDRVESASYPFDEVAYMETDTMPTPGGYGVEGY